jgi:hypothetical protein
MKEKRTITSAKRVSMPLHDHFRPPLSDQRPWEGFHSAWATFIAHQLNNGVLPAEYYAMPLLEVAGRVEVDVAAFQERERQGTNGPSLWAPPQPTLTIPLEAAARDSFEVQVLRNFGGPQLRAAIELISPANKDRPSSRRAFAMKCANHLRRGVTVIIIDIVTERTANLHAEIMDALEKIEEPAWESPTQLYAVAYRSVLEPEKNRLEAWPHVLQVGASLPELPMWLEIDLCVPLRLEESYAVTCGSLRMRG